MLIADLIDWFAAVVGCALLAGGCIGFPVAHHYRKRKTRRAGPPPVRCGKTVRDPDLILGETKCKLDQGHDEACEDLLGNRRDETGFHSRYWGREPKGEV